MRNSVFTCYVIGTFFCLLIYSCKGYTTQQLLDAEFVSKDLTIVDLLAPNDRSITTIAPKFVWSKRNGVKNYQIEISQNSDFSILIMAKSVIDANYTLDVTDLIGTSQLKAESYYWRVRAQYNDQSVTSNSFTFHILENNIVYVHGGSTNTEQIGNKTAPFKTLQSAIENANTRRNGDSSVAMNIYVAMGTYTEEILMRPGISIRGGFEASSWSRNISANTTMLSAPSDLVIRAGSAITPAYTATTFIEGFTITGGSSSINYGIYCVSGSPTISLNTITGGSTGTNYGIFVTGSAAPVISNNTITGGSSTSSNGYGIYQGATGSATISNNTISGGGNTMDTYGIYNTGTSASPTISNNLITAGFGGGSSGGIYSSGSSANPIIRQNNIRGGFGFPASTYGIQIVSSAPSLLIANNMIFGSAISGVNVGISIANSSAVVINNTINGGSAGSSTYAISINSAATPTIRNNIIFTSGGTNRHCLYEQTATSAAASVQNNNFFDCPTSLFRDFDGTGQCYTGGSSSGGNCNNIIDLEADINAELPGTASGNVSINNNLNQLFVDVDGTDNIISNHADNDWHLTTNAAICEVRAGGLDLSVYFTTDKDGLSRTISPISGCTPSNAGAANWSIGAYERD